MTADEPATGAQARAEAEPGVGAAGEAGRAYFDGLATDVQATVEAVEKAELELTRTMERRREWDEGARLTRHEAVLVYSFALARTIEVAEDLLNGKPGVTREDYQRAKAAAESARCRLIGDDHEVPDASVPPGPY